MESQVRALTGLNQEAKGLYRDENVFEDADIQMAGYAAALRVLTRYAVIDGRDMAAEAIRPRVKGETTFVDGLIAFAVDTANQCLVPQGLPKSHWDKLSGEERLKNREIRLVVATDAACEGLNLQTLGTLINVDLPWNPSRLEQRLGRIKRFGQVRRTVDMLNLVYHETQDETVYAVLSRRLKDRYDIFGGLPDTIEDDWIESEEAMEARMDEYMHLRQKARDVFEMRYQETIDPDANRWELCSRVLARRDVTERLSEPW